MKTFMMPLMQLHNGQSKLGSAELSIVVEQGAVPSTFIRKGILARMLRIGVRNDFSLFFNLLCILNPSNHISLSMVNKRLTFILKHPKKQNV
mmetsp:Transcript_25086/g.35931  ORF Transcript_25086/g.35931 Transcript_25086/m.35931 type:complete len:92 (+) Transcript_25086:556-831(+)